MTPTNSPRPAARRPRRWLPYAGAALLLGLIVAGLWPRPVLVETATVTVGILRATVNEEGKTRIKQRYVVSAPVFGQLRRIPFKAGAEVVAEPRCAVAWLPDVEAAVLEPPLQARALQRPACPHRQL